VAELNIQSDSVELTRIMERIRQVRSDLVEHCRPLESPAASTPILGERASPAPFDFDEHTIYASSRGPMGRLVRLSRKLLNPILRLVFNVNSVVNALTRQAEINATILPLPRQQTDLAERVTTQCDQIAAKFAAREEFDAVNYEILNKLVVEMTRLAVSLKSDKMRVESVVGRLECYRRRARALDERLARLDN
jgi:hypothetical protein